MPGEVLFHWVQLGFQILKLAENKALSVVAILKILALTLAFGN